MGLKAVVSGGGGMGRGLDQVVGYFTSEVEIREIRN